MKSLTQRGIGCLTRIYGDFKAWRQQPLENFGLYVSCVKSRRGIEIGGPSPIFRSRQDLPIYDLVGSLDNCDFSNSTLWAKHETTYEFSRGVAPGKTYFCDGSAMTPIADGVYDFVLSSHNLEHFANPVKAIKEWQRVLSPGGALVLILPHYQKTFDHRRTPTSVDHMFQDYEMNVGEDDLTHLTEILEKHDFDRHPGPGRCTLEEFHKRALDNLHNRFLHQHVFDENNSRELLTRAGFEVLASDFRLPFHICLLARAL